MSEKHTLDGKLAIVTSSPGTRDHIFIGRIFREGDLVFLYSARMIERYEQVGTPGIANNPECAVRQRTVTGPNACVVVPLSSVASIIMADPKVWGPILGVEEGDL